MCVCARTHVCTDRYFFSGLRLLARVIVVLLQPPDDICSEEVRSNLTPPLSLSLSPGYEGVPQFFSSLLSHIQSVSAGPRGADSPESTQTAGGPSAAEAGLEVPS